MKFKEAYFFNTLFLLQHPLCNLDYPTPTLELALSLSDVAVMETNCEVQ